MHAFAQAITLCGIDTNAGEVQVYVANGLPAITIFGLAVKAVAECCERVRLVQLVLANQCWCRLAPLPILTLKP